MKLKQNFFKQKQNSWEWYSQIKGKLNNSYLLLLCTILMSVNLSMDAQTFTKTANPPGAVSACDVITYTVTVTNDTGADIIGASISDPVPAGVVLVPGSVQAGATDSGMVPTTIANTVDVSGFDLLDGESLTLVYQVQVPDPYPAGGPANIDNTATFNPGGLIASTSNPVNAAANLVATKTASPAPGDVCAGDVITYTVVVENNGTALAENVNINDQVPANTTLVDESLDFSTNYVDDGCSVVSGTTSADTVVDVNAGDIPQGGIATLTFQVMVDVPTAVGTVISNTATISYDNGAPIVTNPSVDHTVIDCPAAACPPIAECDPTQNIIYLSTTAAGATGPGTVNDPSDPFVTWADAVAAANSTGNATIFFTPNTYSNLTSEGNFDVASITGECITVEGNGQVVNVSGASIKFAIITGCNVVVQNIAFGGFNQIDGSVMLINSPNFVCNNCEFNAVEQNNPVEIGSGVATFNNSLFANNPINAETVSAGAMDVTGGIVNLNNTDFICNRRNGFGGAIDQNGGTINITGGTFAGNIGSGGSGDGGAINVEGSGSTLNIEGTAFTCNLSETNTGDAGGGAIRIQSGPTVTINNAIFSGNTNSDTVGNFEQSSYGGAINISSTAANISTLTITNSSFIDNMAARGGAIYIEQGSIVSIDNSYFSGNEALKTAFQNGGGAIFSDGQNYTLSNSTVENNWTLDDNGGGLEGGSVDLSNSVICGNTEDAAPPGGTANDTGGTGINDLGGNDVGSEGIGNCAAPTNGYTGANTSPLACDACPPAPSAGPGGPPPVADVCEADAGNILISCNCTLLCSVGDDALAGANAEVVAGQNLDFDINSYTAPTGADAADYVYVIMVTDAAGNILDVITVADPTLAQSVDLSTLTNTYAPGDYFLQTYHYLSTEAGVTVPAIGGNVSALSVSPDLCASLSPASDPITVLEPIIIELHSISPDPGGDPICNYNGVNAGDDRYFATVTVTGGYPEYAAANGLKVPLYDLTIAGVAATATYNTEGGYLLDYVDGAQAVSAEITSDNNPAPCAACTSTVVTQNPAGDTVLDQNCAEEIDLNLTKTVDNATPNVGDNVVFTITVTNDGPGIATGVEVTDNLPSGYTFVSDDGAGAYAAGVWTIPGAIAVGGTATLEITATVLATGDYVNIAEVTAADQDDSDSTPNNGADNNPGGGIGSEDGDGTQDPLDEDDGDDAVVMPVVPMADLSLIKTVDNATPTIGDNVVFTITVTNAGPDPATGVVVTDNLPSGFTFVSDDGAGAYAGGVWTIPGTIAVGGTATLEITATVLATGDYVNVAEVTAADQADPDSTPDNGADNNPGGGIGSEDGDGTQDPLDDDDGDDAVVVPVAPTADLSLIKTVDNATPTIGDNVVFTITVTNAGPDPATGVVVTDNLPSGFTFVSDDGAGAYAGGVWTIPGTIAVGGSATLEITATVLATGDYVNVAEVTAADQNDPDSTPDNGADNNPGGGIGSEDGDDTQDPLDDDDGDDAVVVPVAPTADLSLIKTVDNATPNVGDDVVFTITVTNAGPDAATGVVVTDNLPSGFTFVSDDGAGAYAGGVWTIPGTIAVGGTATLEITATVLATGDYVNVAEVTAADQTDPDSTPDNGADNNPGGGIGSEDGDDTQDPLDDDDGDDAVVDPIFPILSTDKTSVADAAGDGILQQDSGEQIDYTITLTNTGTGDAFNVIFTDAIPAGTTLVAGSGSWTSTDSTNGTIADGDPLTAPVGDVSVGETITVTFSVTINNGVTAAIENQATFTSDNHTDVDSDDPNDPTTDPELPTDPTDPTDPPITGDPTVDPIVPTEVFPILSSDKTSVADAAGDGVLQQDSGEQIDYTITLTNTGTEDAFNVIFTDAIPTGTTLVAGSGSWTSTDSTNGTIADGDPLTAPVGDVSVGETITVTFSVTLNDGVTAAIENQATFTSDNHTDVDSDDPNDPTTDPELPTDPTDPTDPPITGDPTVDPIEPVFPILSSDKTSVADAAGDGILQQDSGEQIDYTITLTNTGTGDAFNVIFTDAIPTGTTLVAGSGSWTSTDSTNGTIADGDPLTAPVGDVSVGETITVTFSVTLNDGVTAAIENQATFSSDNHTDVDSDDPNDPTTDPELPTDPTDPTDPPITGDPTVDPIVPTVGEPSLIAVKGSTIVNDVNGDGLNAGDTLEYSITITNEATATETAINVVFTDNIPANTTVVGGSVSLSGTLTSGTINTEDPVDVIIGDLAPGESATVTFQVTIDDPIAAGVTEIVNQGIADADNTDPVPTDDDDPLLPDPEDPTVDPLTPVLEASKESVISLDNGLAGFVDPLDEITYTIVITNTTGGDAVNVVLDDTFDPNTTIATAVTAADVTFAGGAIGPAVVNLDGSTGTINISLGDIPQGGSVSIVFTVVANDPIPSNVTMIVNQGTVTADNIDIPVETDDPSEPDTEDPTTDPVDNDCDIAAVSTSTTPGLMGQVSPFDYNNVDIDVTGGTGPFTYDWDRTGYVRFEVVDNTFASDLDMNVVYMDNSSWSVTITDVNGCEVVITNDNIYNLSGSDGGPILDIYDSTITGETGVNAEDGSIEICVEGGDAPYTVEWFNGSNVGINPVATTTIGTEGGCSMIDGLGSGVYTVLVTDSDGEETEGWYWVPLDRNSGRLKAAGPEDIFMSVYPNPSITNSQIHLVAPVTMDITLELIYLNGQRVQDIYQGELTAGEALNLELDTQDLAAGIYLCRVLSSEGWMLSTKVVVTH